MSFKNKIIITIIFLVTLTNVLILFVSNKFFKDQNKEYHKERIIRKVTRINSSIENYLNDNNFFNNLENAPFDFYDEVNKLAIENKVTLKIYSPIGKIILSSDEEININDSISNNIINKIYSESNNDIIILNNDNNDSIVSIYSKIIKINNRIVGILNLPDYNNSINLIESNDYTKLLVYITITFVLISFFLALIIVNQIVKPLILLKTKLKSLNLNNENKPIEWKNKDEIGELLIEYNNMIVKLEDNKKLLSLNEKESAWREMAKQVAHEIKNPLTPIKLNIQMMQMYLKKDDPNFDDKLHNYSNNILSQIESLVKITNEFSQFAKMPKEDFQLENFNQIINEVVQIFSSNIHINYKYNKIASFNLDKDQWIRVFNNIIKNSIQAKASKINITLEVQSENELTLVIQDNGQGIKPENYNNIFAPNFTTKNSGTGIGLAMVKKIIENHNGTIYFESEINKATIFTIKIKANITLQ